MGVASHGRNVGVTTMRELSEFPISFHVVETEWITLSDGCRLAVRMWIPDGADRSPAPAILENLPYRRRDSSRLRNDRMHGYFAGHGYAGVRVDIRGTGDSDGLIDGEYLQQELEDGVEVIDWIARQPWCSGAVGMMGISWGGFNGLQVAALRPPALKAVVSVASTDDRYATDVHFMGGCLSCDNLTWSTSMFGFGSRPPDPEVVGERWRKMWFERLENNDPWILDWLAHQRRDEFWTQGSVCEDYDAIEAAVYAVCGWADGYTDTVPRLLGGLKGPRKGLIGPWPHAYPQEPVGPGPHIGFLQESLRWWDHWLKGIDTGIMDEPMLCAWMQKSIAPAPSYEVRPGRWIAEEIWPSPHIEARRLTLTPDGLGEPTGEERALAHSSPLTVGVTVGEWCPYGYGPEMPTDQRLDDGQSLVFDSAPLEAPLEILGAPALHLEFACDRPTAMVAVRLNDVAPEGWSARVTYGVLNLTHRDGHDRVVPLEPGRRYRVVVPLHDIAHAFPAGHRVRVAVSTAYWPLIWPSPEPVELTVVTDRSALELPVRPARADEPAPADFQPPECAAAAPHAQVRPASRSRIVTTDIATGETRLQFTKDRGEVHLQDIDLAIGAGMAGSMSIKAGDPLSAINEAHYTVTMARGDWGLRTEAHTVVSCTRDDFIVSAGLDAFEGNTRWSCCAKVESTC